MKRLQNFEAWYDKGGPAPKVTVTMMNGITMRLNCSPSQFQAAMMLYAQGYEPEFAFSFLSRDELNFLLTGQLPTTYPQAFWNEDPQHFTYYVLMNDPGKLQ